jgi:copper resistance protein B
MKTCAILLLSFFARNVHGAAAELATAAQAAPAHVHATDTAAVVASAASASVDDSAAMQEARHMNMMMHGDSINYFMLADRLEQVSDGGSDVLQWEMQGWVGRDLDKFWFKTEGAYDTDSKHSEHTEVQALYSKAVAPFWDVQTGVRQDNGFGPSRTYAVLGVQGLAPYWFDLDAAAFVSERGDLSARLEAEYDLRFTQRILLQPRFELNHGFADDAAIGAGKGLRDASFGLRLRFEVRREFAPYFGVEWHKTYGATARFQNQRAEQRDSVNMVAGVRIWY